MSAPRTPLRELPDEERAALGIRHDAALALMRQGDLDGPGALLLIVCPPPAVRDASLAAARDVSPGALVEAAA